MRRFSLLMAVIGCVLIAAPVFAQNTGVIQGQVTYEGGPMPGVQVTASSPSLLGGSQTVITGVNGEYKFPFLSPGDYSVTFMLSQFKTLEQNVKVTVGSNKTIDAVMIPETVSEEIVVTSNYETVSAGTQASSTVEQDVLEKLAVARNITQAVALSAGVAQTGPSDGITVAGSMSFENLFTMNGVVMNENLRGQPFDMFIEDAIQETTVITSGVSAEYGRFGGGVVNMITKSGGNEFSGSYRLNLTNDDWVGETPLTTGSVDELNKVHEATLGGFLWKDHLWFFLAGRDMATATSSQLIHPNNRETYVEDNPERRYEFKLTFSPNASHRFLGSYTKVEETQTNDTHPALPPLTWDAVDPTRSLPLEGKSFNYTGVITDNFFVEALWSERTFAFQGSGGEDTNLATGTPVWDWSAAAGGSGLFNAPWFCGSPECGSEERNNENIQVKGSYFLGTDSMGTHDIVFGYDTFEDLVISNNWQSATGYAIVTPGENIYNNDGSVTAVFPGGFSFGTYIIWGAVLQNSAGSSFTTDSIYVNDTWRLNDRWTFSMGLRYDKNDGIDAGGLQVADDDRISPRLAASWDVFGDGNWVVNASMARYVAQLSYGIGDSGASAGNPTWGYYLYAGDDINTECEANPATCVSTPEAVAAVMDWFLNVYGGPTNTDLSLGSPDIPGLTPQIDPAGLDSPYTDEFSIGVAKRLGTKGMIRVDYVHREGGDYYTSVLNQSTGTVSDPLAGTFDLAFRTNDPGIQQRKYDGLMTRFDYRLTDTISVGAIWTWSHARGNFDGENTGSGPISGTYAEYPEYKRLEWNMSYGDLAIDQRQTFRAWGIWDIYSTERMNLSFSLLQSYWSGNPYGAVGSANAETNLPRDFGYITPPTTVTYWYGPRGQWTTDDITRTDIALNFSFFVDLFGTELELFIQPEILNLFNESGVIDVSATVNDPTNSGMADFNPYTEAPVEGVNWRLPDNFHEPVNENDYQLARTFRLSLGIRF